MKNDLTFFAQPGVITEPGPYAIQLDGLPKDIGELCRLVQGLTVHIFWAERYGLKLSGERQTEVQLRTLQRRLRRTLELDPHPLSEIRPVDKRIVGNCRDFSVLLVSILRHQGVPARARCGFGAYFVPNHYEDHWVAEYWNAGQERWIAGGCPIGCIPVRGHEDPLRSAGCSARPVHYRRERLADVPERTGEPGQLRHLRHAWAGFRAGRFRARCGLAQQGGAIAVGLLGYDREAAGK